VVTLDALVQASEEERMHFLAPVDALLSSFPSIMLNDALADRFLHGQRLNLAKMLLDIGVKAGRVRVYRENDHSLLGTAEVVSGILAPERLVATA
jgi:tRNA pseudouridine55 synthase